MAVLPFLVLLEQDGADQSGDGVVVGEDLDDVGSALGRLHGFRLGNLGGVANKGSLVGVLSGFQRGLEPVK